MATAPEVSGGMGQGEAQVFQDRIHPLIALDAQREARRKNLEYNQQKLQYQAQQKRNADVQKYIDENIGTPGWFQQEHSMNEINDVRKKTQDFAMGNPLSDLNQVAAATMEEKANAQRRMAKRQEIQKEIEHLRSDNNPRSTYDQNWINVQSNKVYDMDVDQIGRGQVVGIKNHPRAYDADKGIIKAVDDIKNQVDNTNVKGPLDIGYGIQIEGNTKKLRFATDANGQIANETVDFVLDSDPAISQRARWDIARQMAGVNDDAYASPQEMEKVEKAYKAIQFSNDPSIVSQVRGKVRQTLNALQQQQDIDRIKVQNYPSNKSNEPTPEDISNRMVKINIIKNALKEHGPGGKPGTKALNYLAELIGVAKYQGMPVTNLELIPGKLKNNKGTPISEPATLKITMKSGVESGDVLPHTETISVTDPRFDEVMNNLWNSTHGITKEKKITGDSLRGKTTYLDDDGSEEDDDESEFLDE